MEKAKVYFTDFRVKPFGKNVLQKLTDLLQKAQMDKLGLDGKFVAIKIHFGEPGNLSFLRPNFARAVADEIRRLGGNPFLTDCNTLYVGHRKDALDHIESAYQNGFTPYTTGCHIIIGDGLKGTDDVEVPVPTGEYVKTARIGRAVMDADVFVSLNHFKGHEMTGFGGAIKNIGMGCGSRAGKMIQHNDSKPVVNENLCINCKLCRKVCAHNAQDFSGGKARIDHNRCVGCGQCVAICPKDAIHGDFAQKAGLLDCKMAEYALAVVQDRPHFHISLVVDVSPNCDCHPENDAPIVPDVGIFASFDPVALDQACADAVNAQQPCCNSQITDRHCSCRDNLTSSAPETNWEIQLDHAEKIGLGTRQYELITL